MIQKIYAFLFKYKGLIFSWIIVLLLGAFYGKGCSDNKYLRQVNSGYLNELKELNNENGILYDLREAEAIKRIQIEDSLTALGQANIELEKDWNKLNKDYEAFKIGMVDIDTDHKRDSISSAWYPAPGQRSLPPELEIRHDD